MPHLVGLILIGAGFYAGYRALAHIAGRMTDDLQGAEVRPRPCKKSTSARSNTIRSAASTGRKTDSDRMAPRQPCHGKVSPGRDSAGA